MLRAEFVMTRKTFSLRKSFDFWVDLLFAPFFAENRVLLSMCCERFITNCQTIRKNFFSVFVWFILFQGTILD